jgi:hypothetical protein
MHDLIDGLHVIELGRLVPVACRQVNNWVEISRHKREIGICPSTNRRLPM